MLYWSRVMYAVNQCGRFKRTYRILQHHAAETAVSKSLAKNFEEKQDELKVKWAKADKLAVFTGSCTDVQFEHKLHQNSHFINSEEDAVQTRVLVGVMSYGYARLRVSSSTISQTNSPRTGLEHNESNKPFVIKTHPTFTLEFWRALHVPFVLRLIQRFFFFSLHTSWHCPSSKLPAVITGHDVQS